MKLSDAMKKGWELCPRQCTHALFRVEEEGKLSCCAFGAAMLGMAFVTVEEMTDNPDVGCTSEDEFYSRFAKVDDVYKSAYGERISASNDDQDIPILEIADRLVQLGL